MRWIQLLCAFTALSIVVTLQEHKAQKPLVENTSFAFNEGFASFSSASLELMSFGYSRILSNLLWLRFLQQTPNKKVPAGEISWIYLDLDAVSTIDPEFKPVFEYGGIFLSVITEDKIGAERLLKKGIELYPQNWRLRAYLAYHYQFETHEEQKAYEQYLVGSKLPGAPPLLGIVAARYMSKLNSISSSIVFLQNLANSTSDEALKEKFLLKIKEYKKKQHE